MPELRNYHLLISHSWSYSERYKTISDWLNATPYFSWSDYSVTCDHPLETKTDKELKEKLYNRVSNCSCIIVISGMYATYSKWIDYEIECALFLGKPIIGVKPWGQERIPQKIQDYADVLVGWNSESVVEAIRNYAI